MTRKILAASVAALMLAVGRLFRRRHDEAIRRTMPWLVASGAIVPGSIYRRK